MKLNSILKREDLLESLYQKTIALIHYPVFDQIVEKLDHNIYHQLNVVGRTTINEH
jgi:hypothetical protein